MKEKTETWVASEHPTHLNSIIVGPVVTLSDGSHDVSQVATVWRSEFGPDPDAEANARLIAAAPELLAALEVEASYYEGRDPDEWVPETANRIMAIRAAIAKATKGAA